MTNVSRRKLNRTVHSRLSDQFLRYIVSAGTKREAHALVVELLTNAERIMLAKRLGIVVMLEYGYSFRQISKTLKVSPTTVAHTWEEKQRGRFKSIETSCRQHRKRSKRRELDSLLDFVETLLQAGLPPQGKNRWKHVFRDWPR